MMLSARTWINSTFNVEFFHSIGFCYTVNAAPLNVDLPIRWDLSSFVETINQPDAASLVKVGTPVKTKQGVKKNLLIDSQHGSASLLELI